MKRAWPYALALAVVVTGCYLALAPLLRSLSPAPANSSATSQLAQGSETVTVSRTSGTKVALNIVRPAKNASEFVGILHTKKVDKKKTVKKPIVPQTTTPSAGFAGNSSSSSSSSSSTPPAVTPKAPAKTPAKTVKQGAASVGGTAAVNQATGDEGFAGGSSSGQTPFGSKPEAGN